MENWDISSKNKEEEMASKPVKRYKLGNVEATLFEGDYQGGKSYSVKFQKSTKGQDGKWTNSDFFTLAELRALAHVINHIIGKKVSKKEVETTTGTIGTSKSFGWGK